MFEIEHISHEIWQPKDDNQRALVKDASICTARLIPNMNVKPSKSVEIFLEKQCQNGIETFDENEK